MTSTTPTATTTTRVSEGKSELGGGDVGAGEGVAAALVLGADDVLEDLGVGGAHLGAGDEGRGGGGARLGAAARRDVDGEALAADDLLERVEGVLRRDEREVARGVKLDDEDREERDDHVRAAVGDARGVEAVERRLQVRLDDALRGRDVLHALLARLWLRARRGRPCGGARERARERVQPQAVRERAVHRAARRPVHEVLVDPLAQQRAEHKRAPHAPHPRRAVAVAVAALLPLAVAVAVAPEAPVARRPQQRPRRAAQPHRARRARAPAHSTTLIHSFKRIVLKQQQTEEREEKKTDKQKHKGEKNNQEEK